MAWDPARPVPWKRLVVPFGVYAAIAVGVFSVAGKGDLAGPIFGVAMGGVLYLAVTIVMVKFGWNPPVWGAAARADQARAAREAKQARSTSSSPAPRPKPAPTTRTNAGNPRARRGR